MRTLGIFWAVLLLAGCSRSAPESDRAVATRVLAEHIKTAVQPKAVLVISNPFTQQSGRPPEVYAFEKAGLEGLQEGFGAQVPVTVAFPKLKEEVLRDPGSVKVDPQTTTPLSFLVTENGFSEAIQQNTQCDVVVSLIGLPVNLAALKEWTAPGRPQFALLLPDWRIIGREAEILRAFREKKLIAAVVNKPNASEGAAGDYRQQFEDRFILVTPENVEAMMSQFPAVFGLN